MKSKKPTQLYFSSLEVALRELETAIRLFFHFGDRISIHLLASSSANILMKLCTNQGIPSGLHDQITSRIRKEKRDEVKIKLREAYNFFKHGENKTQKTVKFNPEATEYILFDCCDMYRRLTSERRRLTKLYEVWFFTKNSNLLFEVEKQRVFEDVKKVTDPDDRIAFFTSMSPVIDKLITGLI